MIKKHDNMGIKGRISTLNFDFAMDGLVVVLMGVAFVTNM